MDRIYSRVSQEEFITTMRQTHCNGLKSRFFLREAGPADWQRMSQQDRELWN